MTVPACHLPLLAKPTVFISTGCTSSDIMVAPVLAELQNRQAIGEMWGIGGAPLRELGVCLFYDSTVASAVGLVEGVKNLFADFFSALAAYRAVKEHFRRQKPQLVILVDNPGLNLRFLTLAHHYGIPVVYFVPPERWAILRTNVSSIVRKATTIIPIFESEAEFYAGRGGRTRWVGHPMIDLLAPYARERSQRDSEGAIAARRPNIALFPGSRMHEVRSLLPVLREAAKQIHLAEPNANLILCSANDFARGIIEEDLPNWQTPVELVHRHSHDVLARTDVLLTCSGTATLEAAVINVPMVVMYRLDYFLDKIVYFSIFPFRKYPYFSLPNYMLGREAVPELRGPRATGDNLAAAALALLRDAGKRADQLQGLAELRHRLGGPGAIGRTVGILEELLRGTSARPREQAA